MKCVPISRLADPDMRMREIAFLLYKCALGTITLRAVTGRGMKCQTETDRRMDACSAFNQSASPGTS